MKYLGKLNGSNYYVTLDDPDYDGVSDPLQNGDDHLWTLLSFTGCGLSFDHDVHGLEGLETYLESRLDVYPSGSLEALKERCELADVSESGFFDKLAARLNRAGVIMKPISAYRHDVTVLSTGVGVGFDTGVVGLAIVTKKQLRKEYDRKRVTRYIKRIAGDCLEFELNHINDDSTGQLLRIFKDPDTAAADDLGGIYASDYDRDGDKLQFAADFF